MPARDPTQIDLSGKVALITGASRGIGRAIAEAYAAAGARVVLTSRTQETLDEAAESIRRWRRGPSRRDTCGRDGRRQSPRPGGHRDLRWRRHPRNNAGTNPHFGPLLSAEESHWDKTFDVNVKGYFRLAKVCYPSMKARGGGKIINVSSVAGEQPQTGLGVYSVTKAAILTLTEVLARELAGDNIAGQCTRAWLRQNAVQQSALG